MLKNFVFGLLLFFVISPVAAQEFSSLEGTYEVSDSSDLRTATVSKIVLERQKEKKLAHVWFYSSDGDVDWGTSVLKEFSQPGNIQNHSYVGQFKHNQDESFLVFSFFNGGNELLMMQSYTSYQNPDAKHPNLYSSDRLRRSTPVVKP